MLDMTLWLPCSSAKPAGAAEGDLATRPYMIHLDSGSDLLHLTAD